MKFRLVHLILVSLVLLLTTCKKPIVLPDEPQIDFTQIVVTDTVDSFGNSVYLINTYFKILDGDGDFGLKDGDTLTYPNGDTVKYNFFASLYMLDDTGGVVLYPLDLPLNGAIPWVEPIGINQYYKSTVDWDFSIYKAFFNHPVKLKFYVEDRKFHKSNEQETPWIDTGFVGIMIDTTTIIKN